MATLDVPQTPSGLDADPTAYLALPRFNCTLDFDLQLPDQERRTATATYALTDAPPDGSWPILVFFNGLGGHRTIAAMIEGIARTHRVQILTVDKPGAGGSARGVPLPLALRTRWMHAALLAVLAHHRIARFAVLSHSNGLFYALHTLLHLPPTLTATSWTLSGPFVPQSLSGSTALRLAAALPAPLPNALGSLMQLVPPVARAVSWSGGLLSMSAGLLSVGAADKPDSDAHERRKPAHKRGYMHRYVNEACREALMRRAMDESRVAMGQEALFSLHGGDPAGESSTAATAGGAGGTATGAAVGSATSSATSGDSIWGLGPGATDAEVLRGAFTRLAALYPDDALRIHVMYGAADGMVPARGRVWLKGVLEGAGLIDVEGGGVGDEGASDAPILGTSVWTEVPEAGHDDVLFLEEVVDAIFGRVV